jgi:beta-lactamase regulating signal transducer with metallopeptidase domain
LLLSKETFFNTNRGYLLGTPILSLIIPLIQIQSFQKIVSQEFIILLPEIVLSPEKVIQQTDWYQSIQYVEVLFWSGVAVLISFFLVKLFRLLRLIKTSSIEKKKEFTLVHVKNQRTAFSFFNYIFLGKEISETQQQKVIAHELVHSQQKHSLDLLFFEVLKIVMWFNPMIYVYQKRITLLHEYISDAVVVKSGIKETYINNILSSLFQVENISFVNQFYKQSLIKKRIMMMTKTQSKKMNQLKYLLLIPVLASMLFYTACSNNETVELKDIQDNYKGRIEVSGKSYFIKLDENGKETIFVDEKGNKVDLEVIAPKAIRKIYSKDGNIISEIEEVKEEISFMTIDKAPTFPGCEDGDKKCFNLEIQKHFFKNFNSQIANQLGLKSGKNRIIMRFYIDKQGNVADIKVKSPHKDLEAEAIKVINMLPIMTPGEHGGKPVHVKYTLPIRIDIQ